MILEEDMSGVIRFTQIFIKISLIMLVECIMFMQGQQSKKKRHTVNLTVQIGVSLIMHKVFGMSLNFSLIKHVAAKP